MNKPLRDHLLARHDPASPRLDALRRAALPTVDVTWAGLLRELFLPHRTLWQTLMFAWGALLAFQLLIAGPARPPAMAGPAPSPETITALFAQLNADENLSPLTQVP